MEQIPFKEKLREVYPTLTKGQQKVAKYLSENSNVLGMMSAQELATHVGVSESTIIRFSQRMGYPGYLDMKQEVQKAYVNSHTSSQKLSATLSQFSTKDEFFYELIQGHRQALDNLANTVPIDYLEEAANLIVEANTLYIYGEGAAQAPVIELSFWLRRLGKPVITIGDTGRNFFEKVMHVSSGDVAVGFGYRKINSELEILFKETKQRGGHTVLITDRKLAGIMQYSDVVITTDRGKIGEFRSMAIPLIVANALLLMVAKLHPERLKHLKELEELRSHYGFS